MIMDSHFTECQVRIIILETSKYNLYYTQGVFAPHIILIIDCSNDADCAGNADTCVSNYCRCGSNMKCMGRARTPGKTATCEEGQCKCSEHGECSEYDMCTLGVCQQGML